MRKLIEDLHISSNEKDAEIITLKMHLGDEKTKVHKILRAQASQSSMKSMKTATMHQYSRSLDQRNSHECINCKDLQK
jgi:hypothetical protein